MHRYIHQPYIQHWYIQTNVILNKCRYIHANVMHRYIHSNVMHQFVHVFYAKTSNRHQYPHWIKIQFQATNWWQIQLKLWIFISLYVWSTLPRLSYAEPTICSITVRLHQQIISTAKRGVSRPRRIPQSSSQHFAICRMNASNIVIHHLP